MTYPFYNTELKSLLHIKEPLAVVTYPEHPLADKGSIDLKELREMDDPYLLVDWSVETKRVQQEIASGEGKHFEVPPQTALDMIKKGAGVALLTETMVSKDLESGELVRLKVKKFPELYRESVLVQLKKEGEISSAIRSFISAFIDEVNKEKGCEIKVLLN